MLVDAEALVDMPPTAQPKEETVQSDPLLPREIVTAPMLDPPMFFSS